MAEFVRTSGSHVAERVRPVPDTDAETRLLALAEDPESGWTRVDIEPAEPEGPAGRPPQAADKAAWVAYAVARGATQADAEAATKSDLIETYGKGDA